MNVIIATFVPTLLFACAYSDTYDKLSNEALWRRADHDCVNALYLLLRSSGADVSYSDVCSALPRQNENFSLEDLRRAAQQFATNVEVYRCESPGDIEHLQLPLIVYMRFPAEASGVEEKIDNGRFYLLLTKSDESYLLIECGYALFREIPVEDFRRCWTGLVVAKTSGPESAGKSQYFDRLSNLLGLGLIVGYLLYRFGFSR